MCPSGCLPYMKQEFKAVDYPIWMHLCSAHIVTNKFKIIFIAAWRAIKQLLLVAPVSH